jgi:pimeloyl-ACP methyl ester carboxylesterase
MNDLQWEREGVDFGAVLERERGYTSIYLHYNTGRHVSTNGREFAQQLQDMLAQWPVPVQELVILGHSMGGLVTRSAFDCAEQAGHDWQRKLSKVVFLGTPHLGAPLERGGNWVHLITDLSSYSAPFSRLAKLRSAGITDLRHGSVRDEDWQGKDRFAHGPAPRALPLPQKVSCYTVAATIGRQAGAAADRLAGDGLVPLSSALGQHSDPARQLHFDSDKQATVVQTNHMQLLNSPEVRQHLLDWL